MELHVYMWLIVILLSLNVGTSLELTCEDLHCVNNECLENQKCLHGCMDGFIVDAEGVCVEGCTGNCSVCDNGLCESCRSGYFGLHCSQTCNGCKNGSCEKSDGKCASGCRHGFKNPPFCDITDEEHAESQKQKQAKEEERLRGFFIWIAGAITLSVLSAIGIMIILVVMERHKNPGEPAAERLYRENNEITEIV